MNVKNSKNLYKAKISMSDAFDKGDMFIMIDKTKINNETYFMMAPIFSKRTKSFWFCYDTFHLYFYYFCIPAQVFCEDVRLL